MTEPLSMRQMHLLALVVREHVETAQPVASGPLVTRYDLGLSPATVRNELALLEEMGLLMQPHTSAGRVPTVAGYRFFVENLMSSAALPAGQKRMMRLQFQQAGGDAERWLQLSAAVIAQTSGMAGLVSSPPRLYRAGLRQILIQPEFEDHERFCEVVAILEEGEGLQDVIDRLPSKGVQVIIGGEPPLDKVPHVTLILARFGNELAKPGDGGAAPTSGVLGVVGPTRLPYERAVPTVGFMARLLTQMLSGEPQDPHAS